MVKAPPVKSLTVVEWARKKKKDRQKGIIKRIGVDFILFILIFMNISDRRKNQKTSILYFFKLKENFLF